MSFIICLPRIIYIMTVTNTISVMRLLKARMWNTAWISFNTHTIWPALGVIVALCYYPWYWVLTVTIALMIIGFITNLLILNRMLEKAE